MESRPSEGKTAPPAKSQFVTRKILRMCMASLRLHLTSSVLQGLTIAATAGFLVFVAAEIVAVRLTSGLPTAEANPEGKIAQLIWMLAVALIVCVTSNLTGMLLSVTGRFREIGTMKCLGAFDGTILALFLVEATLLGGGAAVAGGLTGLGLSAGVILLTHGPAAFSVDMFGQLGLATLSAVVLVTVLSFLGAAYPAWQASRMLPIVAMRAE